MIPTSFSLVFRPGVQLGYVLVRLECGQMELVIVI